MRQRERKRNPKPNLKHDLMPDLKPTFASGQYAQLYPPYVASFVEPTSVNSGCFYPATPPTHPGDNEADDSEYILDPVTGFMIHKEKVTSSTDVSDAVTKKHAECASNVYVADRMRHGDVDLSDPTRQGNVSLIDSTCQGNVDLSDPTRLDNVDLSDPTRQGNVELSDPTRLGNIGLSDPTRQSNVDLKGLTHQSNIGLIDSTCQGNVDLSDPTCQSIVELIDLTRQSDDSPKPTHKGIVDLPDSTRHIDLSDQVRQGNDFTSPTRQDVKLLSGLTQQGNLDLSDSRLQGNLDLSDSRLQGNLDLSDSRLQGNIDLSVSTRQGDMFSSDLRQADISVPDHRLHGSSSLLDHRLDDISLLQSKLTNTISTDPLPGNILLITRPQEDLSSPIPIIHDVSLQETKKNKTPVTDLRLIKDISPSDPRLNAVPLNVTSPSPIIQDRTLVDLSLQSNALIEPRLQGNAALFESKLQNTVLLSESTLQSNVLCNVSEPKVQSSVLLSDPKLQSNVHLSETSVQSNVHLSDPRSQSTVHLSDPRSLSNVLLSDQRLQDTITLSDPIHGNLPYPSIQEPLAKLPNTQYLQGTEKYQDISYADPRLAGGLGISTANVSIPDSSLRGLAEYPANILQEQNLYGHYEHLDSMRMCDAYIQNAGYFEPDASTPLGYLGLAPDTAGYQIPVTGQLTTEDIASHPHLTHLYKPQLTNTGPGSGEIRQADAEGYQSEAEKAMDTTVTHMLL